MAALQVAYAANRPRSESPFWLLLPVAVTANGSSLDISGLSAAKFGTLSGGTLTLQVLQSSGQLGTATFAAAGQNAFNAAVQALQQQAQASSASAKGTA